MNKNNDAPVNLQNGRLAQIQEGIRQANADQGIDHEELMARLRAKSKNSTPANDVQV